jgi:YesN/AraC family two-component response regulator
MLIDVVKKRNIHSKTFDLLITRYLLIYIIGVIIFEILIIIINTILPISVLEIRLFEMSLTLLFVLFGIYVLFNQKIILIQSRLELYSNKIDSASNGTSSKNILSEAEKLEIKNTIEHFLEESKLYLNPNLTLDLFARKIHIQPRKISKVINLIHNKNFHQFINGYRIAAAIQIMAGQKEINIENLYTKFGFNSRSTFNRVFKEITGKSPSGYLSTHKSSQR